MSNYETHQPMATKGSRGRRASGPDTRAAILAAAQAEFSAVGYEHATIRAIATRAGVDPALIYHYVHSKQELFMAAMLPKYREPGQLPGELAGGIEGVGRRLADAMISLLGDAEMRNILVGIIRASASNQEAAETARYFIERNFILPACRGIDLPDVEARVALAGAHMVGLVFARYVIELGPLASLDLSVYGGQLAVAFQAYFE